MAFYVNIIGFLFYLLKEILNLVTQPFCLFLVPLFWYSLCISGFTRYLIFMDSFSLYLLFWYSIYFSGFSWYLVLWYIILLSGSCWYLHFSYASHTSGFPWYFAFLYAIFDVWFSICFSFFTVLQILFYHHISVSMHIFSFLDLYTFFNLHNLSLHILLSN